ncbi:MAG: HPF/RaiA family ribosome-associated protein [Bacillota bacterium]
MQFDIQGVNIPITPALQQHAQRRFGYAMDRFQGRIRAVTARLSDINGERGGVDTRCTVDVRFTDGDHLVVQYVGENAYVVIDQISTKIKRTITRHLSRRRTQTRLMRGRAMAMA